MRGDKDGLNENIDLDQDSTSNDEIWEEESPTNKSTKFKAIENSKWNIFFDEGEEKIDSCNDLDKNEIIRHVNSYQPKYNKSKQYNKKRKVLMRQNDVTRKENVENDFVKHSNYNPPSTSNNKKENLIINSANNYNAYRIKNKMDNETLNENYYNTININSYLMNQSFKATNINRDVSNFTTNKFFSAKISKWSN